MEIFNTKIIISIIIYLLFIFWLGFALYAEYKDTHCQDAKGRVCGVGLGRAYSTFKPHAKDSREELFEKLRLTSRYELNSITWRRSFIIAIICAFLVLFVVTGHAPSAVKLSKAFLVCYIVIYLALTMFQNTIARPALKQAEDIMRHLKADDNENNNSKQKQK
jgi:hypothetical protein